MSLRDAPITSQLEQDQLERLLAPAFHVPEGQSFYDDFPVWDGRNGAKIHRPAVFEGDRLVASAGARLANYQAPGGRLTIAIIGAVVTDPAWRGRGLASRTTENAVSWAKKQGASLAVLWGSEHSLYGKLGFGLCGEQRRAPLATFVAGKSTTDSAMIFGQGWRPDLFETIRRRGSGLAFEEADLCWFSAHKNTAWHWVEKAGKVAAYAAFGRGIDLANIVHEWGGEADPLMDLLAKVSGGAASLEIIGSPELFNKYGVIGPSVRVEHLCMARLLDLESASRAFGGEKLLPLLRKLPENERAALLFGDVGEDTAFKPAPLWFWGLDAA